MELKPSYSKININLFEAAIKDMYLISEKILSQELKIAEEKVLNSIKSKIDKNTDLKELKDKYYFQVGVLDSMLFSLENKNAKFKNSKIFNFVNKFIISATSLIKDNYDEISIRHYYSLIIYIYCILECFCYFFKNETNIEFPRGSFISKDYINFNLYLVSNELSKIISSVYNSFRDKYFSGKKKKEK